MTDKQLRALGKLGRTKSGRAILRDHGPAILSFLFPVSRS